VESWASAWAGSGIAGVVMYSKREIEIILDPSIAVSKFILCPILATHLRANP